MKDVKEEKKLSVNDVYLSETEGLTMTAATNTADRAKEFYETIQRKLNAIQLYSTYLTIIGSKEKNLHSKGWDEEEFKKIPSYLNDIKEAKAFEGWLRVGVKAKARLLSDLDSMTVAEFASMMDIKLPESPMREIYKTKEDVLATMSINERSRIHELENETATYGWFIHNNGFNGGAFANAREDYNKKMSAPVYANANGRDTLFYEHVATIPEDAVDDMFFGLLQEHRSKQAELNGLLSKVERELTEDRLRVNAEYAKKCKDYLNEEKEVRAQFDEYLEKERKRIADLKIVLPNRFKAISEKIESLGKRKKK